MLPKCICQKRRTKNCHGAISNLYTSIGAVLSQKKQKTFAALIVLRIIVWEDLFLPVYQVFNWRTFCLVNIKIHLWSLITPWFKGIVYPPKKCWSRFSSKINISISNFINHNVQFLLTVVCSWESGVPAEDAGERCNERGSAEERPKQNFFGEKFLCKPRGD